MFEVRFMRPKETPLPSCIETYPASDGLDRCIHTGAHSALHVDEYGRSWSTEMVTTVSQEQPQPIGERGVCNQCEKDLADCQCVDGDDEEFEGDYIPDDYR